MADVLGLFDMSSFNFGTPPGDYTDVTPGFLLDFGDETGPNLHSAEVHTWLLSGQARFLLVWASQTA